LDGICNLHGRFIIETRKEDEMNQIHSYPSVMQIGHKMIADIFTGDVLIEEKIDGSQFSFGLLGGELVCRSKGKQQLIDAPDDLFKKAIENVRDLDLHPNWTYRGEFLAKPKHNTLPYARVPKNNIIIFDVNTGLETYMSYEDKVTEAERLGFEIVPKMYQGNVDNFEMFKDFLAKDSILGGCKVEGVVVKNYNLFTAEKKVAMGKYVSENFKEVHGDDWKQRNPSSTDFEEILLGKYRTPARWEKAIQHLRDNGLLEGSPKDIGALVREVPNDVLKECEQEIKDDLFAHFWPRMSRGLTHGLPEYYKDELAKSAFDKP
jgi:hypothetical protein